MCTVLSPYGARFWCTRYGLVAIPHHSCPAKARSRWNESEREALKASDERYETDDGVDVFPLFRLSGAVTLRPFACGTGVRDGRKRLRLRHGKPLRKILTQARLKSFFLRHRRTCQITLFIIIHLFEIIYDFTLAKLGNC